MIWYFFKIKLHKILTYLVCVIIIVVVAAAIIIIIKEKLIILIKKIDNIIKTFFIYLKENIYQLNNTFKTEAQKYKTGPWWLKNKK